MWVYIEEFCIIFFCDEEAISTIFIVVVVYITKFTWNYFARVFESKWFIEHAWSRLKKFLQLPFIFFHCSNKAIVVFQRPAKKVGKQIKTWLNKDMIFKNVNCEKCALWIWHLQLYAEILCWERHTHTHHGGAMRSRHLSLTAITLLIKVSKDKQRAAKRNSRMV